MNSDLLTEVQNEQARAKVGAFGSQGSGKTTTLALLAIGISKTYHNGAPLAMMDTEAGADFLKPLFDAEGVKLLVRKSGAFSDMVKVLKEAERIGCCAFIMDSVTHTWRELVESYCTAKAKAYNRSTYAPQFQDWKDIKAQWATWTFAFVNSPLHCFVAGRAGYEYEYQEGQDGKKELIKGDTKMKAEGEFGYEPSLLIEMETERRNTNEKHRGGNLVHIAHILKDRARVLNGKSFEFPDINEYNPGDWQKVFKPFAPHFGFLNVGGTQRSMMSETSEELFDEQTGDTEARQRSQSRKIALEEMENIMGVVLWPGATTEIKRIKLAVVQALFKVRAWSAVETMPLRKLEDALWSLQEFEKAARDAAPEGEEAILGLLRECMSKVARIGYIPGEPDEPKHSGNGHAPVVTMAAPKAQIPPMPAEPGEYESSDSDLLANVFDHPKIFSVATRYKSDPAFPKDETKGKRWLDVFWGADKYACWDTALWAALTDGQGKSADLEVKVNGKYKNIVGVNSIEGVQYSIEQGGKWRPVLQQHLR